MPTTLSTGAATFEGFKSIEDKEYYEKTIQTALHDPEDLSDLFEKKKLPKNHGHNYSWRKMSRIKPRTEVLAEGVLPDPNSFSLSEYTTKVYDYGDWVKITRNVETYAIDPLWTEVYNELGYSAKEVFKQKREELLYSTKNRWFAGATNPTGSLATIRSSLKPFQLNELPKIRAFLKRSHINPWDGNDYICIISPEVSADLQTLTKDSKQYTLVEIANYQQTAKTVYSGEIGKILNFRFVERNAIIDRNGVHTCYILGKTRGKKPLSEIDVLDNVEIIAKPTNSGGVNNALNQIGSLGWKKEGWGAFITDDAAVIAYECKPTTAVAGDIDYPIDASSNFRSAANYSGVQEITADKELANGKKTDLTE